MSYLAFHLIFIIPLLVFLLIKLKPKKLEILGLLSLSVIALVYTTPWDNYLVEHKVWTYSPNAVLGTLGFVPYEEYLFMFLQPIISGATFLLLKQKYPVQTSSKDWWTNIFGATFLFAFAWIGYLLMQQEKTLYLGILTAWVLPPLALQWGWGLSEIIKAAKPAIISLVGCTLYLCIADRIAIHFKVWEISPQFSTGFFILGLPVEEIFFFALTNMAVIQGLQLLMLTFERKNQCQNG
jgi:lycopene cyclase domain-containing protein